MQILTILAIVTGVCAPLASAKCFNTGEHWGSHADAKAKLTDACKSLAGSYSKGQTKSACRNGADFKAFNFEIQNKSDKTQTVDTKKCFDSISREIDNCGHGGQETIGGIRFRGDPNKGDC